MKTIISILRIPILLLCLFISCTLSAQQQFRWVKGGGSPMVMSTGDKQEKSYTMCTDANGNIYSLNIVADWTVPIYADTFYKAASSRGNDNNILVSSYTCDGTMRWAKLIGSNDGSTPWGITVDTLGHVYIAGGFASVHAVGGVTFYIGNDTTFTSPTYQYGGVIQLDTNGNYKWIRLIGTNAMISSTGVGYLTNPLVMDGNANVHFLCKMQPGVTIKPSVISSWGVYDMTYDVNGNLLSNVRLDLDSQWALTKAVIDPVTNKLYVTGTVDNDYYMGGGTDTQFVAAFDASRNRLWRYDIKSSYSAWSGITLSQRKNLFLSGAGFGTFTYNGHSTTAPTGYYAISIIARLDTNGGVRWMKRFDSKLSVNSLMDITLLPNDKVASIGGYTGVVTDEKRLMSINCTGWDPYMVIVDSAGDLQALEPLKGFGFYDWGDAITSDRKGNVYLGGEVVDSIWAGTPPIKAYKSVGGGTDFFVMKYGMPCNCTYSPLSYFTHSGVHTLSVAYTGTTTGLDSVVWNFGDGSATVSGISASHTYTLASTYRVCATVYTTCGNDIYCEDVVIPCGPPVVASFTDAGMKPKTFTYTGTTAVVDSVTWDFGDGSPKVKSLTPTHTYAAIGVYTVCATAWSICGNNTSCHTVTITCVSAPTASFSNSGYAPLNVTYTGTIIAIDSIVWNFGDGGKATGLTSSHNYTAIGSYTVCVTAYTRCGSNTACKTLTIPCIATPVSAYTDTGVITLGTTYTGSTAPLDSVVWNFGDGSATVKGLTAFHTFTAVGVYTVCATAYNPCGSNVYCSYDTVRCITAPVASFSDTGKKIVGFTYTGTTDGIDSIIWNFGDGQVASGNTALHTYSASGTYNVCVTIYTPCGIDSVCKSVTAKGLAVPVLDLADIKVYPNPANDELNITGIQQTTNYRLLAITGVTIKAGIFNKGNNTLPINQLVPGIYMLEMNGIDGSRKVVRVVKE